MIPPRVVFVESNTSGTGRLFARRARALGFVPLLLTSDPTRFPFCVEDHVTCLAEDTSSFSAMRARVDAIAREGTIAGIYSSSEYYIEMAAKLAEWCALTGPPVSAVRKCRNKWQQRRALAAAGIRVPSFQRARSLPEVGRILGRVSPPVVVKPTMGTGSIGVRLCHTHEQATDHAAQLLAVEVNERGLPVPREVLVEEYVEGPEFSAEAVGSRIVGLTRKYLSPPPYFVEIGHDFPAVLRSDDAAFICAVVRRALQAVRLDWGPSHVELRLTSDGPVIIEINPRLAGGFIPELVRLACGVDLVTETVRLVTGGQPDFTARARGFAAIRFVVASTPGRITAIEGLDRTDGSAVTELRAYRRAGDRLDIHHDFRDRVGHAMACAETAGAAAEAAAAAARGVRVLVERDAPAPSHEEHRQIDSSGLDVGAAAAVPAEPLEADCRGAAAPVARRPRAYSRARRVRLDRP